MLTIEQGARTSLYCATSAEVAGESGRYYDSCKQTEPSKLVDARACRAALGVQRAVDGRARAEPVRRLTRWNEHPPPEIAIDADLAARLVRDAASRPRWPASRWSASGWDNTLFRLGDELCLRLPRRRVAADLVVNEHRWLPSIAARVRVPMPGAAPHGEPTGYYPWPGLSAAGSTVSQPRR